MGSDAKNLMSDGNVQIIKVGEIIGTTQLTEGELIVEAGGRAENIVITRVGWLKVTTGGIAKCAQYGNNDTPSVSDDAIATDIVQSEGGAVSPSTLATVNSRHPEGEFGVDKGYACGLLLEDGDNLRVLEGHHAEKTILDQEGGLLVNGATSAVVANEGGELLVHPGGEASNCEINQSGVFILAGKASDTLLAGGTMNNLGGEGSDIIIENGAIYRLGTDSLQLYSPGKMQNLSVNVGGWVEVHVGTLENAVIQGKTVILLSSTSTDENFAVGGGRASVELTGNVALLDGVSMIIGYGADLQQSATTVQQGGALILDGSTIKGDSVAFSVGNINLNGRKLWLIIDAATRVHLKAKCLRGEGVICLQISAKEISPDSINVKGEVTGDIYAETTDASR